MEKQGNILFVTFKTISEIQKTPNIIPKNTFMRNNDNIIVK